MEGFWNFPLERRTVEGKLYFPTRALLPPWSTVKSQAEGERRFQLGRIDISQITTKFDIQEMGLSKSPLYPDLPVALDSHDILPLIAQRVPVDGHEVLSWMQRTAADNAILTARMAEYNRYSQIDGACGDGNIPGVRVSDIHFNRQSGYDVASTGNGTLVSPVTSVSVPVGGGSTLIAPDILGWGGIKGTEGIQFDAQALKWIDLAETPITNDIGFPSYAGIVAPNFFLQKPDEEGERARVTMVLASDKEQRLPIKFRSTSDYTKVIDGTFLSLNSGETEVSFIIASYPSVPTVVLHAHPPINTSTVLRQYRVEVIR